MSCLVQLTLVRHSEPGTASFRLAAFELLVDNCSKCWLEKGFRDCLVEMHRHTVPRHASFEGKKSIGKSIHRSVFRICVHVLCCGACTPRQFHSYVINVSAVDAGTCGTLLAPGVYC